MRRRQLAGGGPAGVSSRQAVEEGGEVLAKWLPVEAWAAEALRKPADRVIPPAE